LSGPVLSSFVRSYAPFVLESADLRKGDRRVKKGYSVRMRLDVCVALRAGGAAFSDFSWGLVYESRPGKHEAARE
jgi:hypothetical protein